uniref:Cytokine like 1 n=1 Tax=Malurus cyaneus samueli TaxID=2593467 RepID=A0A8C5TEF8_9PASS
MKMLLPLIALLSASLLTSAAPSTCYSRVLSLSKEITESFKELQTSKTGSCVETLPRLYLDIHNYCVLAKLREFVAYPGCDRVAEVNELKEKARSLYTILTSYCRRVGQDAPTGTDANNFFDQISDLFLIVFLGYENINLEPEAQKAY